MHELITRAALRVTSQAFHHFIWQKLPSIAQWNWN